MCRTLSAVVGVAVGYETKDELYMSFTINNRFEPMKFQTIHLWLQV